MNIAMACNENWYQYLVVNLYSLLKCTKNIKKIYLILETDNIKDVPKLEDVINKYPVDIELINFNNILDDLIEKKKKLLDDGVNVIQYYFDFNKFLSMLEE